MNPSRLHILNAVRAAQGPAVPLPSLSAFHADTAAPALDTFTAMLEFIGARWVRGASLADAIAWVEANVPPGAAIASTVPGLTGNFDLAGCARPHDLQHLHTAILPGRFGVCENGAIWLDAASLGPHRVLPFIAEHLVILLPVAELVATMHHAYARLDAPSPDFGVFIAGPSKTADIEQCLVIGAHGARGCTVFIFG